MYQKKTGLWALIIKIGLKILPILGKLLKATKFLKFGLAAASFITYSMMFTWKFAILILIALAFHESGHVWAMRKMGIKTKGFYFIPFLGAAAIAEESYKTYGQNSFIALMGPVWGLGLSMASCAAYYATGNPIFAAAAGWMAFINIFNLFPVNPLDGGQVVRSIAFSIHKNLGFIFMIISLIVSTILMFKLKIGLFAFLIIVGIIELIVEFFRRRRINKAISTLNQEAELASEYTKDIWTNAAEKIKLVLPTAMNNKQLALSVGAYAFIVAALIVIVKLMAHIPAAGLAEQFLAE
jgi:Zn-dependent protease